MLQCGTDEQLKIELLSQWKLEAEFRKKHPESLIALKMLSLANLLGEREKVRREAQWLTGVPNQEGGNVLQKSKNHLRSISV